MRNASRARPGFATTTALFLVALVGVASGVMMTVSVADARRTDREIQGAQLRQLLTAGALAAQSEVGRGARCWNMDLPTALDDCEIRIDVKDQADSRIALIGARLGTAKASQQIVFRRAADGRWEAASVAGAGPSF
jgi:hypothetical protein